jgi:hypothetical protein
MPSPRKTFEKPTFGTNTLDVAGKMRPFWNRVLELISNAIPEAIGRLSPPFRGRVLELRRPWI